MRRSPLLRRSLVYYWRTNLAVVAGVAAAVSVLAGALLVGDSVRQSLRNLVLQRLGNTDYVISSTTFFRERLADELQTAEKFRGSFLKACPIVMLDGLVTHQESGRRASGVFVYGVDHRFWEFQGLAERRLPPRGGLISPGLREELAAANGDTLLVRVEKPSGIPTESLHGRKEDGGMTLRLRVQDVLPPSQLAEFSTRPQQESVRAVFVPIKFLQQELEVEGKANVIAISSKTFPEDPASRSDSELLRAALRTAFALEDLGVRVRTLKKQEGLSLESDSAVLSDHLASAGVEAGASMGLAAVPVLVYLANTIRSGSREIPYSVVAALDLEGFVPREPTAAVPSSLPPILLNQWAAEDLGVPVGSELTLEYYLWGDGKLSTHSAPFHYAGIVPMDSEIVDADLSPKYPGISDSTRMTDWDPPFPVDMKRVRPHDEEYWKRYRTAPKALVRLKTGQQLWASRFGKLTSLRFFPGPGRRGSTSSPQGRVADPQVSVALEKTYREKLKERIDPAHYGYSIFAAKSEGLKASRGAADFGEYFLYFSFFLAVSALLLTVLFFRLGIEQRLKEIGILQVSGFNRRDIRTLFLNEGILLAAGGAGLGAIGALLYSKWILFALRTWWMDAVNTTLLRVHVSAASLIYGAVGGIVAAILCISWTLRSLRTSSPRELVLGAAESRTPGGQRSESQKPEGQRSWRLSTFRHLNLRLLAAGTAALAVALIAASVSNGVSQVFGFFGAGTLLLVSFLLACRIWILTGQKTSLAGNGWKAVARLGFRGAAYRPGRSLLCIALIASATFMIVAVNAFRKGGEDEAGVNSGTGGFSLLAESQIALQHDPNIPEGKAALGISPSQTALLENVRFEKFRFRSGDDASCLNLYQARNPRILAPSPDFISAGRFRFQQTLAETDEERTNPWLLLNRSYPGGAVPVIADANSLNYVLHLKLGEELVFTQPGRPVRLKVVAALRDSLFQKELLMSDKNFLRLFPDLQGFRFFLVDAKAGSEAAVTRLLEDRLSDFGFDVSTAKSRLEGFHQVENTYLSTFQFLGALGLLLGTFGLATVLLRNVLERRRELALLRSAGFTGANLGLIIIAENLLLLLTGVIAGTGCAAIAILPAFYQRGGTVPLMSIFWLVLSVITAGLIASLIGTRVALRAPLLATLRAE